MSSPPPLTSAHYRVFSAFRRELDRFLHENERQVRRAGLTPRQFSLLLLLGAAGEAGVSVGEAARDLDLAHNSVVGLSQRAEGAGLLERVSRGTRRQGTRLHLTPGGTRRLEEVTRGLISNLAGERSRLVETLSHWNAVLAAQGLLPGPAGRPFPASSVLRRAGPTDRPLVWKLLQLYLDELSVLLGSVPDESGEYGYPHLDRYWQEEGHAAYLFHVGSRPAGFALVCRLAPAPAWHRLDEFCVLRAYRGRGLGAALAGEVLRAHPGRWTVPHLPQNLHARHFWAHVLPGHALTPPAHAPDDARPGVWQFHLEVGPAGLQG